MGKSWFGFWSKPAVLAGVGIVLLGLPVHGAVVEHWSHHIEIDDQGLVETLHWRVLVEDLEDVDEWNEFPVYLNEHRELLSSEAWVISPNGDRRRLKRKERDLRDMSSSWELRSSRQALVFEPEGLLPGGRLEIRAQIRERPYYPGTVISLRPGSEAFEKVEVSVRRAPSVEGFRLLVHGPLDEVREDDVAIGLRAETTELGINITGQWPRRGQVPELAASTEVNPKLYLAWNTPDSWGGVARWYRDILKDLPRASAAVRSEAQGLLAQVSEAGELKTLRRSRLERLVDFARAQVRYVAVEVGIGGYRPTPSEETLDRRWGDCKDKSFLLMDLLQYAEIEAYPALVRLDDDGRIRTDFPTPYGFNHLIVAVPVDGLAITDDDPVADGFLFVDPTQTTGSAGYLHRSVQDQSALVVMPTEGRLVRLPVLPDAQYIGLDVELDVTSEGSAQGRLALRFTGDFASSMAKGMDSRPPKEIEEQMRQLILRLLPGADVLEPAWDGSTDGLPRFEVTSKIRFDALVEGLERGGSIKLDGFQWAPDPASIDELEGLATSLPVATVENRFRIALPEGFCPPKDRFDELDNDAASFVHRIAHEDQVVHVERRTRAKQSWFAGDDLEALKALAVAEHRAPKRRLRFRCP